MIVWRHWVSPITIFGKEGHECWGLFIFGIIPLFVVIVQRS